MKNRDIWKNYEDATKQASNNIRWLAGMFFGWILLKPIDDSPFVLGCLISLLLVFFVDILQYTVSALVIKFWTQKKEGRKHKKHKSITEDKKGKEIDYEIPRWLSHLPFAFWILKIGLFSAAAYYFFRMLFE